MPVVAGGASRRSRSSPGRGRDAGSRHRTFGERKRMKRCAYSSARSNRVQSPVGSGSHCQTPFTDMRDRLRPVHLSVGVRQSEHSTESVGAFSTTRRARATRAHLPASLPTPRDKRPPVRERPACASESAAAAVATASAGDDDAPRRNGRDRRRVPASAGPAHGAAGIAHRARVLRPRHRRRDALRSLLVRVLAAACPPPAPAPPIRCVKRAKLCENSRPARPRISCST